MDIIIGWNRNSIQNLESSSSNLTATEVLYPEKRF